MASGSVRRDNGAYFAFISCCGASFTVPQRVQRLLIADFAGRFGLNVGINVPRLPVDGSFAYLTQKILEKPDSPGFIAYSIETLGNLGMAVPVLEEMIENGYHMWFASEEVKVATREDFSVLFEYETVIKVSRSNADKIQEFLAMCRWQRY